jgi:hypothetical protein
VGGEGDSLERTILTDLPIPSSPDRHLLQIPHDALWYEARPNRTSPIEPLTEPPLTRLELPFPAAHIISRRVACYVVHSVLFGDIFADLVGVGVVVADDDDELGFVIRRLVVYERLWDDGGGWVRVCEGRSWFPASVTCFIS